jgi:HPt (histidine-containing phosphotransfer) domain-containing protein
MSSVPPPTPELVELASVLGEDNVRTLVRTFLRDFPASLAELGGGDRKNRHRIAHSMKSNSRLMGGHDLSKRLAALEARLETADGADVNADDLTLIERDYELIGGPLRDFVGPS